MRLRTIRFKGLEGGRSELGIAGDALLRKVKSRRSVRGEQEVAKEPGKLLAPALLGRCYSGRRNKVDLGQPRCSGSVLHLGIYFEVSSFYFWFVLFEESPRTAEWFLNKTCIILPCQGH